MDKTTDLRDIVRSSSRLPRFRYASDNRDHYPERNDMAGKVQKTICKPKRCICGSGS